MPSKRRHRVARPWKKSSGRRFFSVVLRRKLARPAQDDRAALTSRSNVTSPELVYSLGQIDADQPSKLATPDGGIQLAPEIWLRIAEKVIKSDPKAVASLMVLSKVCHGHSCFVSLYED